MVIVEQVAVVSFLLKVTVCPFLISTCWIDQGTIPYYQVLGLSQFPQATVLAISGGLVTVDTVVSKSVAISSSFNARILYQYVVRGVSPVSVYDREKKEERREK